MWSQNAVCVTQTICPYLNCRSRSTCHTITLYMCCARFVNLRNLQNALRNFEIAHAQLANFYMT